MKVEEFLNNGELKYKLKKYIKGACYPRKGTFGSFKALKVIAILKCHSDFITNI